MMMIIIIIIIIIINIYLPSKNEKSLVYE